MDLVNRLRQRKFYRWTDAMDEAADEIERMNTHDRFFAGTNCRQAAMTAEAFNRWLSDMKLANIARSDAACARLLGVSANSVVAWKNDGTDRRTALACRALLERLEPYS
jgi:truncated hemoglobin YjbI